jgi:tetratricopeptide (TPR) repeat protein
LRNVFGQLQEPFLLVLDDFEANFEKQDNQLVFRDGAPVLSTEAKKVIEALTFAIRQTNMRHRLIITSRYKLDTSEVAYFYHEPLTPFRDADLRKKIERLESERARFEAPDLKLKAIEVSDGNPRLLEWLYDILTQKGLDHELILNRMEEKAVQFRESILAEELLKQQVPDLRNMLGLALVYELPVPKLAIVVICAEIPDLDRHLDRAAALGLLETMPQPFEIYLRVPRILSPLLEAELPDDMENLNRTAAQTLYRIWREESESAAEEQALEIHRLALAGKTTKIAVEMADILATQWHSRSRFREVVPLCEKTLKIARDDYRILHNLARSEQSLGHVTQAMSHYQQALQDCPDEEKREKASISHNMAGIYETQGKIDAAIKLYQQSLEIHESIGDVRDNARTLHQMAGIYETQGQIDAAIKLYQQSLELKESIGNVQGKAATLAMMGQLLADERGDFETALAYLQESLAILEHLRSPDAETVKGIMARVIEAQLRETLGEERFQELLAAVEEDKE